MYLNIDFDTRNVMLKLVNISLLELLVIVNYCCWSSLWMWF